MPAQQTKEQKKADTQPNPPQPPVPSLRTQVAAIKGISKAVSKNLKTARQEPGPPEPANPPAIRTSLIVHTEQYDIDRIGKRKSTGARVSQQARSIVTQLATRLDMDEYEFPDDDDIGEPLNIDAKLDVTALDRYNDDIRRLRKLAIDECRLVPQKGDPDDAVLSKIKLIVKALCRTAFYGTHKAVVLAEGAVTLITWILNRRNIRPVFKIHIMQSFAEMMWTSLELKLALYKCKGIKVITNILVHGVRHKSDLSRWACYTLAMACISSTECIAAVLEIDRIDEVVGEIAFYSYWINWPANFGSILQGILFGPHSVIPIEDSFDFI